MRHGNELPFTDKQAENSRTPAIESKKEKFSDMVYDKTAGVFYFTPLEEPSPLTGNSLFSRKSSPVNQDEKLSSNLTGFFDELPDLQHGHSYKGDETTASNMIITEESIPQGFKKMTMWSSELQSFCIGTVPEETPELTDEEYEKYASINPQ